MEKSKLAVNQSQAEQIKDNIVGYKLKAELEDRRVRISRMLGLSPNNLETFMRPEFEVYRDAEKLKVLDVWFDPVFKKEKELRGFTFDDETWVAEKGSGWAKFGGVSQNTHGFIAYLAEIEEDIKEMQDKKEKIEDMVRFMEQQI